MRIKKVTLHGVGPFEHQEIEFREGKNPELADVSLLVGENGTGKSTILYAIADQVDAFAPRTNQRLIQQRLHDSKESFVRVDTDDLHGLIAEKLGEMVDSDEPRHWAAFAYAAMRQVDAVHVDAIRKDDWNPLSDALSFTSTSDARRFAQWLANTNYSRLQAKESIADEENRYLIAIRRIERALKEVLGESIAFDFPIGELTPRVFLRGERLSFEVLPDGLKSVLSWVADLFMRHDALRWKDDLAIEEREFLLLLDEIDVHLHPAWQRRVLPLAQRLFPKAQIIATTHSPLVVASADDAHVVVLRRSESGQPTVHDLDSQIGSSYSAVLRSVFGIESEFDKDTQEHLDKLHALKRELIAHQRADRVEFDQLAKTLAARSEELSQIVAYEKRQLDKQLGVTKKA